MLTLVKSERYVCGFRDVALNWLSMAETSSAYRRFVYLALECWR